MYISEDIDFTTTIDYSLSIRNINMHFGLVKEPLLTWYESDIVKKYFKNFQNLCSININELEMISLDILSILSPQNYKYLLYKLQIYNNMCKRRPIAGNMETVLKCLCKLRNIAFGFRNSETESLLAPTMAQLGGAQPPPHCHLVE